MTDQPLQHFATGDQNLHPAPTGDANQAGATKAWQSELHATLAPADSAHAALGSLIGAKVETTAEAKPAATDAKPATDAKAQKLDSEYASMAALGMGDMHYSGAQKDTKALGEQAAQKARELAQAGSHTNAIAFNNVFDQVLDPAKSAANHAGFHARKPNGLFRDSNPNLETVSAYPQLNTTGLRPQLSFQAAA